MKRLAGIFGGLVVVLLLLPMPVRAEVSSIVLTHIQAGLPGDAKNEFIVLANDGDQAVDISGWCLQNKTKQSFFCFEPEPGWAIDIDPDASIVVASEAHVSKMTDRAEEVFSYKPANQSSGSLVGSSDTVRLIDDEGNEQDVYSWTTSWSAGAIAQRHYDEENGVVKYRRGAGENWRLTPLLSLPVSSPTFREVEVSIEQPPTCETDCEAPIGEDDLPIRITELLPNVAGTDAGREYIELFNPNDHDVDVSGYLLSIHSTTIKSVPIPSGVIVLAKSYLALYSTMIDFSLGNTIGYVAIHLPDGVLLDQTAPYEKPPDDKAWALIEGEWQYTDQLTPGAANKASVIKETVTPIATGSAQKPCAANQYRHPETNRCRRIVVAAPVVACKVGYYRSAETGRCRKQVAATTPAPCREGQARNLETGRCRTVKQMTTLTPHTLGVTTEERPQQWYVVGVVMAILAALIGYAVWEWREEMRRLFSRFRTLLVKTK